MNNPIKKATSTTQARDVLIIDDDPGIVEVLEAYCENMGCFRIIVKANDGSQASVKMRNQKFALILMDINMPRKSGIDLLREFDKNSVNSVDNVVIISGELGKETLALCLRAGVKNFLVKPFDEPAFQQKILQILKTQGPV